MEVKSDVEVPVSTPVETPPERQPGFLMRSLSRKDLTLLTNWGFRAVVLVLAIFLLTQPGTKWLSAFVFGCGFAAVGIGVYLTFRVLNFPDLTIEGSYTLGAAVALSLISHNNDPGASNILGNPWVATALATVCGGLAGLTTGLLHTKLKINGLLASILVTTGLYSVNLHILAPSAIISLGDSPSIGDSLFTPYTTLFNVDLDSLTGVTKEWLHLGFFALLAVALIVLFNWFLNTQWGLALRATGDNENMIRALGVNTDRAKITLLVLSNGLFGLAGAVLAQYLGYVDGQFGVGMIVIGLAAVILGESFIAPVTTFTALAGTLVGAVIYRILFTGVYGLELSWALTIRVGITVAICGLLAYLVFLTLNNQTPSYINILCLVLGGVIAAILSSWLFFMIDNNTNGSLDNALIFKAEQYDIRIVLAVLIVVAMGVPALRSRIGTRALKAAGLNKL